MASSASTGHWRLHAHAVFLTEFIPTGDVEEDFQTVLIGTSDLDIADFCEEVGPNLRDLATDIRQAEAPLIPEQFRGDGPDSICAHRGHKVNFSPGIAEGFLEWVRQHDRGCTGRPDRWPRAAPTLCKRPAAACDTPIRVRPRELRSRAVAG
jgi:hypothetical protein